MQMSQNLTKMWVSKSCVKSYQNRLETLIQNMTETKNRKRMWNFPWPSAAPVSLRPSVQKRTKYLKLHKARKMVYSKA